MKHLLLTLLAVSIMAFSFGPGAKMRIIVVDENSSTISGAKVTVYATHANYENETNEIAKGETNAKGFVEFKGLKEQKYYILISKDGMNNHHSHNETDVLKLKGKNRFEIMIN